MAKITVIKEPEGDRSPFLRGVLVQSLVNAGLAFDDAYDLAQAVRDGLHDRQEVTTTELKDRVIALLAERHDSSIRRLYEAGPGSEAGIIVHTPTRSTAFSVGILAHSLETCAIPPEKAIQGARKVLASLRGTGHREIDHKTLRRVIYRCLHEHCSQDAADRYLSWRRFENSDIPLIILIGGVTGSGKSTVSSELAFRLDINRHQSTDMMREVIRSYLSPQMMPTLEYASFEAWRGLPSSRDAAPQGMENQVVVGFLSQLAAMKLALEATIRRSVMEKHDLIMEGVHVVPNELDLDSCGSEAVVIPVMLASMKRELLQRQLGRRSGDSAASRARGGTMDDIWALQSWLLDEADRAGVYIIENANLERTVRSILDLVIGVIMKQFPPHADDSVWEA